jgi:sulfite reductase (ferredoxin)
LFKKRHYRFRKKNCLFRDGKIDDERFRSLRLARSLRSASRRRTNDSYQIAFGKVISELVRITKVSDEYSTGRLHITTRQDIQIHYVSLDRTPQLWAELEKMMLHFVKLVETQ